MMQNLTKSQLDRQDVAKKLSTLFLLLAPPPPPLLRHPILTRATGRVRPCAVEERCTVSCFATPWSTHLSLMYSDRTNYNQTRCRHGASVQHTAAAATCARVSGVLALRLDWKFVETESNSRGCFVMKDAAIVSLFLDFFPLNPRKVQG